MGALFVCGMTILSLLTVSWKYADLRNDSILDNDVLISSSCKRHWRRALVKLR